jgi:hypothetical protein
MKLNEGDLDVVIGLWDLTVQIAIDEIEKENIDGKDAVDKIIDKRKTIEESKDRQRNEKTRGNQKFCRSCKKELIEVEDNKIESEENVTENSEYAADKFKKIKIMVNEAGPIEASLVDDDGNKRLNCFHLCKISIMKMMQFMNRKVQSLSIQTA